MPIEVLFPTSGSVIRQVKIVKKQKIPFDDGQDYFKSVDYGVQIHLGSLPNSTRFNFGVFTEIGLRNMDGGAPKDQDMSKNLSFGLAVGYRIL